MQIFRLCSQPAELPQPIHRLRDLTRRRLRILCGDGVEALAEGFGRHGAVITQRGELAHETDQIDDAGLQRQTAHQIRLLLARNARWRIVDVDDDDIGGRQRIKRVDLIARRVEM